jgi:glycosyltransferase involved in cell wall biosynthesis
MSEELPLVSVLIGTYNREDLIRRCLDSIFNQSYINIEVIVIDDCSSDDTPKVLSEYKLKYPNQFKCLRNKKNMGIAYNSNKAFELSRGDYIALIGDDDFWIDRSKLEKQIDILKNNTHLGISGTWWQEFNENNNKYIKKPLEPKNWKERMLSGGGVICGSTPLIKKETWLASGGFDENQKRGTDSDLFRRIILSGYKASILYEVTTSVDISVNRTRMTALNNITMYKIHISSMKYNLNKLREHYHQYPKARAKYHERLSGLYLAIFREYRDQIYIMQSKKYIKLSIKDNLTFSSCAKFIRVSFLGLMI